MPTPDLLEEHSDFVWKVLLAEAFIKLYMDLFGFSKEETERRMSQTPMRPGDDDDDEGEEWWALPVMIKSGGTIVMSMRQFICDETRTR